MNKLEIKHLAPYLPYNLGVQVNAWNEVTNRNLIITSLFAVTSSVEIRGHSGINIEIGLNKFKPILRPLSDLTKEIEVNGERFVPLHLLMCTADDLDFNMESEETKWFFHEPNYSRITELGDMNSLPYWLNKLLFEWHFDVFGLIPKGLAIDINTL